MNKPISIYIASAYTIFENKEDAVNQQINLAEDLVRTFDTKFIIHLPLLLHYWDNKFPHDYEFWMDQCINLITYHTDCIYRIAEPFSNGADREVALANKLHIPVFYTFVDLCAYYHLNVKGD